MDDLRSRGIMSPNDEMNCPNETRLASEPNGLRIGRWMLEISYGVLTPNR